MSIIALAGIPNRVSEEDVVKSLVATIRGPFEALNFIQDRNDRTAYLRLSEKLDPLEIVEKLNGKKLRSSHLRAYLPDEIPDFPYVYKPKKKTNPKRPLNQRNRLIIPSHWQLMREMQMKYTGLYDLSAGTGNQLLNAIAKTVYQRLSKIVTQNVSIDTCFKLTKVYRKRHPHFADFQFILSTLHMIQDAAGKPRDQIQESELASVPSQSYVIDNIPFEKVHAAYTKYSDKVVTKIVDHIKKLEMKTENTSLEDAARYKVREQLKNLLPYVQVVVRNETKKHFMPQKSNVYRVKVYGEPFLPPLGPFMKRHEVLSGVRSNYMYNMMSMEVPKKAYMALLAADSTLIGGAKLVIRPSNLYIYEVPKEVIKKASIVAEEAMEEDIEDIEEEEEWNEE